MKCKSYLVHMPIYIVHFDEGVDNQTYYVVANGVKEVIRRHVQTELTNMNAFNIIDSSDITIDIVYQYLDAKNGFVHVQRILDFNYEGIDVNIEEWFW